ncbi:MAG: serine/threonine protein kinase [Myxococcaceae bacterium]|nr:serine/threonine protein kinase [Myxococcaceae bacterium]
MSAADPFGLVGQVLDGQFRVDKLVGEGGFSAVYRGHHQGLNEPIAVKCLKLPAALGTTLVDTFVQRFRDESRILYRLSQGNLHVVRSIAAGTTQAPATGALVPYMVLEWLEGRSVQNDFTVRRTVGEKGRSVDEVVKLFDTAADGLAYAHSQGVAHRDLNPGNLFLANTQHGVKMKVLDFGVAKLMHDGALNMGPRAQTVGQIKIFAPAYGAPEQFDDRIGAVGVASDVYSFALILLEALRDRNVVEGTHLGEFAQTTTDPNRRPTPRALGIDVPDEVEQAFVRATTLDPAQRWNNVGDFWQSLTIALKHATERKYENAARETPPLAMGAAPGGGAFGPTGTAPGPAPALSPLSGAGGKGAMARTMPLSSMNAGGPGLPRPAPGASRPRIPTTIGIPAPASGPRPAAAPIAAAKVPVGAGRTLASPGTPSAALAPPAAPPRTTARPPSSPRNAMPNMPNLPPLQAPAGMGRPNTDRPAANAPATARFPAAAEHRPGTSDAGGAGLPNMDQHDDNDDDDEATRVHAPAPEVLQTLALQQAVAAKNAAAMNRVAAARPAAGRPAAGMPPPSPESSEEAAALEAAARDAAMKPPHGDMHGGRPAPVTPLPPSLGGTLMMSPGAHAAAQHAVAAAAAAQGAAAPHAPAPQPHNLNSTLAMNPPPQTPGLGFTPPPFQGSSMQGHPQGHPQSADPMFGSSAPGGDTPFGSSGMQPEALFGSLSAAPPQATEPLNLANMQGMRSNSVAPGQQQQGQGMQPPYGHGSAMVPSMHGQQGQQGQQGYGAPHGQQSAPFPAPTYAQGQQQVGAPKSAGGLPILPIAIALGVLAVAGGVLAIFALRARHGPPPDPIAMSASADPASLTPVPVPVPVPVPQPEATAVPSVAAVEVDASIVAVAPEPATPPAPVETSTAAPTATATATVTATTATAAPFTPPPTPPATAATATAMPKPAADPNAFNEGAAKTRLAQANGVLVICQKGSGVSGPGSASVTFAPDGSVSAVSVDPPYAGTKEGDCAAAQFRRAKVGAFTGSPQTVRHSFEVPK